MSSTSPSTSASTSTTTPPSQQRPPDTNEAWSTLIAQVTSLLEADTATADCAPTINFARDDQRSLARSIDHTLLKTDATEAQIASLCDEARTWGFKTVCIRPPWIPHALAALKDSSTAVCTVIAFPEGTHPLPTKMSETTAALAAGAQELDFVINYPLLHERAYTTVFHELTQLTSALPAPITSKLILEISQLASAEIVAGTVLAFFAGFEFVKTSTGFAGHGATVEGVRLMRRTCHVLNSGFGRERGGRMKVKASGGIRTWGDAWGMLEAGAERLGVSAGVAIVEGAGKGERGGGGGGGY